jgi:hypothetical protein
MAAEATRCARYFFKDIVLFRVSSLSSVVLADFDAITALLTKIRG